MSYKQEAVGSSPAAPTRFAPEQAVVVAATCASVAEPNLGSRFAEIVEACDLVSGQ